MTRTHSNAKTMLQNYPMSLSKYNKTFDETGGSIVATEFFTFIDYNFVSITSLLIPFTR